MAPWKTGHFQVKSAMNNSHGTRAALRHGREAQRDSPGMSPLPREGSSSGGARWCRRHKLEMLVQWEAAWERAPWWGRDRHQGAPGVPGSMAGATPAPGTLREGTHLGGLVAEPPQQQHHNVHSSSSHLGLRVCLGYGCQAGGDLRGQGRGSSAGGCGGESSQSHWWGRPWVSGAVG